MSQESSVVKGDPQWSPSSSAVIRRIILVIALLFAALLTWAAFASVDRVVRGEGKVIPSGHIQLIQSAEGGVLAEMMVRQGDMVDAGQPLAKIDDVQVSALAGQGEAESVATRAEIARLEAEVQGSDRLEFPPDLKTAEPVILATEKRLFEDRRRELRQALRTLDDSLALSRQRLSISAPLAERGLISEVEMIAMRRDIADLQGRRASIENSYRSEARARLAEKQATMSKLREAMRGQKDRLAKTVLRSPVHGIVKQVHVTTLGGYVKPGDPVMEIVPVNDDLLIETYVNPADIAFLRKGLPALVRVTAFDYAIYGGLEGEVELISADSVYLPEQRTTQFRVLVRTRQSYYQVGDRRLYVSPGMTATADVITGKRTVLEYLLKPLYRAKAVALTER